MESEEDDGGIQLLTHLVHRWRTMESRGSEEHITTSVDANSSPNKIPANNMVAARPRAPPYPPPKAQEAVRPRPPQHPPPKAQAPVRPRPPPHPPPTRDTDTGLVPATPAQEAMPGENQGSTPGVDRPPAYPPPTLDTDTGLAPATQAQEAVRPRAPPYPPPEVCGEQGGFVPTVFYGPPTYLESLLPEWVPGPPAYYHPLIDDESRYLNPIPSGDYRVVAVKSRESAVVDDRPAASQETASERAARVEKAHRAYEAQVAWAGYQPEHRSQDIEELD